MKKLYFTAIIFLLTQSAFAGEFFVRVMRPGYMTASFADQVQSNSSGIFRFFELPGGMTNLRIQDQYGNQLYNASHFIGVNQRVVAEISQFGMMTILETQNNNCMVWNYGGFNQPGNGFPGNGNVNNPGYDAGAFSQFLATLDKESFDSNKLTTAKGYADKTQLSARQIADISRKFSFDSNRLEWAKYAYAKCYDKANYFLLKETFSFSSSYNDLQKFIDGR